ncbi:hypothetical protein EV126DRAFT_155474 [Verticillium dahliae]|nr:hypothetical protein EV126DRAFT_155474 [Verticillium dahliae]
MAGASGCILGPVSHVCSSVSGSAVQSSPKVKALLVPAWRRPSKLRPRLPVPFPTRRPRPLINPTRAPGFSSSLFLGTTTNLASSLSLSLSLSLLYIDESHASLREESQEAVSPSLTSASARPCFCRPAHTPLSSVRLDWASLGPNCTGCAPQPARARRAIFSLTSRNQPLSYCARASTCPSTQEQEVPLQLFGRTAGILPASTTSLSTLPGHSFLLVTETWLSHPETLIVIFD